MSTQPTPRRVDDILGQVRWCPRCEEWLPEDEEFWYIEERKPTQTNPWTKTVYHCICCKAEKNRITHSRARYAARTVDGLA